MEQNNEGVFESQAHNAPSDEVQTETVSLNSQCDERYVKGNGSLNKTKTALKELPIEKEADEKHSDKAQGQLVNNHVNKVADVDKNHSGDKTVTMETKRAIYENKKAQMEQEIADKWKAWKAKYSEGIQRHLKEASWKNPIPGVRREKVSKQPSSMKYAVKAEMDKVEKGNTSLEGKVSNTQTKTKGKKQEKGNEIIAKMKDNKTEIKAKGINLKLDSGLKENGNHTKMNFKNNRVESNKVADKKKLTNKDLFQMAIDTKKKFSKTTSVISNRPQSAGNVPRFHKTTNLATNNETTGNKTDDLDKEAAKVYQSDKKPLESEIMRNIIDQYVIQNCGGFDWIHWMYNDMDSDQVMMHLGEQQLASCAIFFFGTFVLQNCKSQNYIKKFWALMVNIVG